MILALLALVLPLLFFPWRATCGAPREAGEAAFLWPRWTLIACATMLVGMPGGTFRAVCADPLTLLLSVVVIVQTVRVSSAEAAVRGTVWIAGLVVAAVPWSGLVAGVEISRVVRAWWWAPFVPVMLYVWSQRLFPAWDLPWFSGPVVGFDPAWVKDSANADQVLAAVRFQAPAAELLPVPASLPPSTLGGSHFTAEILAAVAVAAPWPAAVAAMATMVMLRSRIAVGAACVAFIFSPTGPSVPLFAALALLIVLLLREQNTPTLGVRKDIWRRTLDVIKGHPWFGVGTAQFHDAVAQGRPAGELSHVGVIVTAHSEYLERAAEWGVPGGCVFAAWVGVHAWGHPGALALAVAAVAGHSLYHPVGWFLFCLLVGLGGAGG